MNTSKKMIFLALSFCSIVAFAGTPPTSEKLMKAGETSYKANCVLCHGDSGKGDGIAGMALKPRPRNFSADVFKGKTGKANIPKPTVEQVFEVLNEGIKDTTMAPFKHLSEEERWGLSYYVLKLRGK